MANKGKHLIENDYTPVTYDPQYILMVNHLKKYFPIKGGLLSQTVGHVKAVDGVTFNLRRGCTMGLVGESGCGKSTTGRTILRLGGEKTGGPVLFNGKEVYDMTPAEMRELRTKMQIIFQDPFSSLSPRLPVGEIIGEAVREHNLVPKNEFNDYIDQVMDDCGLQPYHKTRYPHEFSGGQRQRICIARALALNPEFVVCDEPVSALDVSIQAQIINLLKSLQEKRNLTYLFISHDLSVVEHISDTVGVMYLGNLVEYGETDDIFAHPLHPYTRKELYDILWPVEGSRLLASALQAAESSLIPYTLAIYTGSRAEAVAQYGSLKGMALPLLFFPFSVLGALSGLLMPEITRAHTKGDTAAMRRLIFTMLRMTGAFSLAAGAGFVLLGAPLAGFIYRDAKVGRYVQLLGFVAPFMYLESMVDGVLKGLGEQLATFRYSLFDSVFRIAAIWLVVPQYGMMGFLGVMAVSNLMTCGLNMRRMMKQIKKPSP